MLQQLRPAVVLLIVLTVVTGIIYPAIVTAVAHAAFPHQANGSLIGNGDQPIGSELLGQSFTKPEYFWGRLSATQPFACNAAASSGSNFGPLHPQLKEAAEGRIKALRRHAGEGRDVPVDLVTSSASGLDPHISPAAAEFQVPRIAKARRISEDSVRQLVDQHTQDRQFGVLGEPRVNVVRLNLALDQQSAK